MALIGSALRCLCTSHLRIVSFKFVGIGLLDDLRVSNIMFLVPTIGVIMEQPSAKILGHLTQVSEPAAG